MAHPIHTRNFAGNPIYTRQLSTPLRVAHITDQHVGRITPMATQRRAIAAINDEQPDIVALTGDFVCHSQRYLEQLTALLEQLEAPAFAVLGNHDHYSGAGAVRQALHQAGVTVLDNAWTAIRVRGDLLQVVGIDDDYTGHADVRRATRGLDPRRPALGLSHIAEQADKLWVQGVPLVLSGHTHGGQLAVGGLNTFGLGTLAGHRYIHGLYGDRTETGAVYVGAGIGAAVVPLRMGERGQREVAIFALGRSPDEVEEHHTEQPALPGRKPSSRTRARRAGVPQRRQKWRQWLA